MKHVVMFSGGAGSWAAARRVADRQGTDDLYLLFSDVGGADREEHQGEDDDNYRFLHEAATNVGGQLVIVRDGRDVWQVFKDQRMIGNTRISNCSRTLKQEPARRWLNENCVPEETIVYVGIDWSETHRLVAVERQYQPYPAEAPLCDPPYLEKNQILDQLRACGIEPPRLYEMGFAHANCGGFCVRAGQGQFLQLLETMPERYAYHERQENEMRRFLDKDVAILRDRRGGTTKPLTLTALRQRIEGGEEVDKLDLGGCGCFVDG